MTRNGLILITGLIIGIVASSGWAQEGLRELSRNVIGAFYSKNISAFYDMSIELDGTGKPKAPRRIKEDRQLFAVADYYGKLVEITQHGDRAVFWYEDHAGEIRNVVFDRIDSVLMRIQRREVKKLRFEVSKS